MSWKKNFRTSGSFSPLGSSNAESNRGFKYQNYGSTLPEVYLGHPNRIERYNQMQNMDLDSEVAAALDIISEFSTQYNDENLTPFKIEYQDTPTETEVDIIDRQLRAWCAINEMEQRMFRIFRNVLKFGDQLFVRDPETFQLYWVDMPNVTKIIVNESEGKKPEQYVLRNINPNFQSLAVTQVTADTLFNTQPISVGAYGSGAYNMPTNPYATNSRFALGQTEIAIDAEHIVHLSLSEGLDNNWPFGTSILESVFKVYKQKELLEDAIIIYRVQRAPERRVFKIDVGNMPPHLAMAFVERVKNEVHQRRIPTQSGGSSFMDSTYNPLSINEDYYFPQTCLSLDTEVQLLDNRKLSLNDIIDEYNQGKENFVYTVNQKTHLIEPGKIAWAGITRKQTQVLEVELDNGSKIIATPDHRFITRTGDEVQAQYLQTGDSLMPLYLHGAATGKQQGAGKYLQYICPATSKKRWVHTMVCPKDTQGKVSEIHHIDLNSLNNNPTNLIEMETKEHRALHSKLGTYYMTKAWQNEELKEKMITGMRNFHATASDEVKQGYKERGKKYGAISWANLESRSKIITSLVNTQKRMAELKTIHYSDQMFNCMVDLFNKGYDSVSKMTKQLRTDENFQKAFFEANANLLRDKNRSKNICPTDKTLNKLVQVQGYTSWGDFKQKYCKNHKVVAVRWLEQQIDTGDLTIVSANENHNFALACGIFVHNSDGRGSSVDTLPGGQNLGEIDDLKFFTNKLFRGLRIPSSYLPTGAEDSEKIHSDGKVGTALIQEHRFNQYCKRLQLLMEGPLDREFKAFLKWRGFNLDTSMFNIRLCEPQNFAQYRQGELDSAKIQSFMQLEQLPYMSKRFMLKRYLGLSEAEMLENSELWREERVKDDVAADENSLRNVGISPGGVESDLEGLAALEEPAPMPGEPGAPEAGAPGSLATMAGAGGAAPGGMPPA